VLRTLEGTIATLAVSGIETPAYVYDLDAIEREADDLRAALRERDAVFYAVKANSAGSIIRAIASRGCGADVVTGAELALVLRCGIDAEGIVYSGVAKSNDELDLAISSGTRGIRAIQVESIEEIARVDARARAADRNVRIAIRVNPGLDLDELAAHTHAHIVTGHDEAKFGIAREDLSAALDVVKSSANVTLVGVSSHVGSQFFTTVPYLSAARVVFELATELRARGHALEFADTGAMLNRTLGPIALLWLIGFARDLPRPALFLLRVAAIAGTYPAGINGVPVVASVCATRSATRRGLSPRSPARG